jgi:hypothetical protein
MKPIRLVLLALIFPGLAHGFDIGEFKNGMTRAQVQTAIAQWQFARTLDLGPDSLLAFDPADSPAGRRYMFHFCGDKLAGFEQEIAPAFRHFMTVAGNHIEQYGNPLKVLAETNVIANGEKHTLAMFWRRGSDYIGVRYTLFPVGEQLTLTAQVGNNCWQAPR